MPRYRFNYDFSEEYRTVFAEELLFSSFTIYLFSSYPKIQIYRVNLYRIDFELNYLHVMLVTFEKSTKLNFSYAKNVLITSGLRQINVARMEAMFFGGGSFFEHSIFFVRRYKGFSLSPCRSGNYITSSNPVILCVYIQFSTHRHPLRPDSALSSFGVTFNVNPSELLGHLTFWDDTDYKIHIVIFQSKPSHTGVTTYQLFLDKGSWWTLYSI